MKCYFHYDPNAAPAPVVTGMPASVNLGQTVTGVSFQPAAGCSATGPASYSYQFGESAPQTVTATNGCWAGSLGPVGSLGPLTLSVTAYAASGNPGAAYTQTVMSYLPLGSGMTDGYFSGGSYPDLLTPGTGAAAGLWLYPGTGNGAVGTPVDIGGLGNGHTAGATGPGDWAGATILHGNLLAHGMQDVLAYYPADGSGIVTGGSGTPFNLNGQSGYFQKWPLGQGSASIASKALCDSAIDASCINPISLVPAGNASQIGVSGPGGVSDLIGIAGPSTTTNPGSYNLDLYTATAPGTYAINLLSLGTAQDPSPDGNTWNNYTLATAQLPDTAYPHGDPANTVLFALDKATGNLWESANPNLANPVNPANSQNSVPNCVPSATAPNCTIIGTRASTWTKITVPWGATPPALIGADVTNGGGAALQGEGQPEIWTQSGTTANAYTVTAGALGAKGPNIALTTPGHEWPMTDGTYSLLNGTAPPTTAVDTVTAIAGGLHGTYTWTADPMLGTMLHITGHSALIPPTNTVTLPDPTGTISMWFRTSTPDGVLAGIQVQQLGTTTTSGYYPVLYIGTNGLLYGEWWTGAYNPLASTQRVDDGQWHHVTITANTSSQTMTIDGVSQTLTAPVTMPTTGFISFGAGYLGGSWPNEPYYKLNGNEGWVDYFNGDLSGITYTK